MKTAYFDCFAGVSGDMIIGSFLDSGFDFFHLEKQLSMLDISGYEIFHEKCFKNNIYASRFNVIPSSAQPERSFKEITEIIKMSRLNPVVKNSALSIFTIIAEAEALIHNTPIEKIHFHEIGAIDSIIDICGAAICFYESGITSAISSPINTGSGFVKTSHGSIPVPAPATAEILKGIPVYSNGTMSELATPTGAAIIKHYCSGYSPLPYFKTESIGYGAGNRDFNFPNVLRLFIGESSKQFAIDDEVTEIEASIDDMNPEIYSYLFELLFSQGALDVSVIPAFMKKNRPGHIMKILTPKELTDKIAETLFMETSTSGLRINTVKRKILERNVQKVNTIYGDIRVKIHKLNGISITVSPEYEDCKKAAIEYRVSIKEVYNETLFKVQADI